MHRQPKPPPYNRIIAAMALAAFLARAVAGLIRGWW